MSTRSHGQETMSNFQGEEPWELFYWAHMREGRNRMVGRGEFIRLLLELAGVPYTDHGVTKDGGEKVFKFVKGGENTGFPAFAPPVIKKGDFVLSQTPAIMKLLGKEFGYYPDDARDEAHADSMMAFVTDFVAEGRLVFHSKKFTAGYAEQAEDVKPTVAWFESERLHQFLSYLEKVLKYNANLHAGGFAIGQKLTYVDIAIFHAVDAAENQFAAKFAEIRSEFPHVTAHKSMVASLPNIAAYLASDRRGSFAGDSMM